MRSIWVSTAAAISLSACATPAIQPPLRPPATFAGPEIAARTDILGDFVVQDGARLPYIRWAPAEVEPWAVVVALHGFNDSRASFRLAGPWWAERGIETWAYDQRGFGQAPGRGVWAGETVMTEDLRTIVALIRARRPNAVIAVVGESMGGSVAIAAFGSDRPPDADRLVLLAPGVWGWSSQNPAYRAGLWVAARALGDVAMEPPQFAVRNIRASDNRLELIRTARDPNSIRATRFDTLSGLVDLMETATVSLGAVRTPTALFYGRHDQIIEKEPMRRALQRVGPSSSLRTAWHGDGGHILNRDLQAEAVYRDVEAYLRDPAAAWPSGATSVLDRLLAQSR